MPDGPRLIPTPRSQDTARDAAWQRIDPKLRQLGVRRAFLADLLLVGVERVVDELLGVDNHPDRGDQS